MTTVTLKVKDSAGNLSGAVTRDITWTQPPPAGVLMGMNFIHGTVQPEEARAEISRIYVPAGLTNVATLSEFNRAYNLGVRTHILSWKDTSTATIGPLLDSVPDDCTVYGVAHHEPEDDMTASAWQALQAAHMPVVRAHGAIPLPILMQWTLDPASGRVADDWILPKGLVDVQGFDFYPKTLSYQAAGVTRMRAFMAKAGLTRYAIGEYGVDRSNPPLGVSLINDFKQKTADAEVSAYWSQLKSPIDYHFTTTTADAWYA